MDTAESIATTSAHDFQPVKVIVLSELSTREKERYYRLLLLNNAKFRRDESGTAVSGSAAGTVRYVANIRLLAPNIRKSGVTADGVSLKKKDTSNYALIFQERLTKLRNEGFIEVVIQGLSPSAVQAFDYNAYPRFTALIAFQQETVRPKLRPLAWVMKYIEDIYDHRFAHERHDVERDLEETSSFDLILLIFPVFVVRKLGTNVGLKNLMDQTCWDLLYSIHVYRQDYLEVETFARFLQEFYDHDDLLFYLYVRSVISKVLHLAFKTRWMKLEGPGRQAKSLWMSYREACHVAKVVFGNDNDEIYREFMSLVGPQMVGMKSETTDSRRIDITEYLHLSVVGYHQSQARNQSGNERFLVPLPGQIAPIEPVPMPPSALGIQDEDQQQYEDEDINMNDNQQQDRELEAPDVEGVYANQRHTAQHQPYHNQNSHHNDQLAEAYDYQHHGEDDNGYDQANGLIDAQEDFDDYDPARAAAAYQNRTGPQEPIDYYYDAVPRSSASQQSKQRPTSNNQNNYGNYDNDSYHHSQSDNTGTNGSDQFQQNSFEELQNGREAEFMGQLMAALHDCPSNIYEFTESALREQLRNTVNVMLQDKQIHDLEGMDRALLDILQLDELRVDMEALRDEIVQNILASGL